MWTSAKMLGKGLLAHWLQLLGGTGMAIVGLVASINKWEVPPKVWVALSLLLFGWAILQAFHDLRLRLDGAEEALADHRDHQRIADTLLERYQSGIRLLQHVPLNITVRHEGWIIEANRWMKDTLEAMKAAGCTPHDMNWVEPSGGFAGWHGGIQAVHQILDQRAARVGEVGAKYQTLAEKAQAKA